MLTIPLYDKLLESSKHFQIDNDYQKKVTLTINNLPKENIIILYALILHHANLNSEIHQGCPYKGTCNKKSSGISYNFYDFPETLRKIICIYVLGLTI